MLLVLRRGANAPRPGTAANPVGRAPPTVVVSNTRNNGAQTADGGPRTFTINPYPDVNAGFSYPPRIVAPVPYGNGGSTRRYEPATQTDFALKTPVNAGGPRWNGLLLGLPAYTISYQAPGNSTYEQVLGAAVIAVTGTFPTQYSGLRVQANGRMVELSVVAIGDAPSGMGGVWRVQMASGTKAVYLVETTDPNASPVRIKTTTGVKSARLKT